MRGAFVNVCVTFTPRAERRGTSTLPSMEAVEVWGKGNRPAGTVTPMPPGALLAIAIAVEVCATIALRYSDGFSKPLPTAIVIAGYATSFWLLSLVLKHISVSTTYAIWAGAGTAAIAIIGIVALGEPATALKLASIALIIVGVIGLNASGAH
jgi:small multidrug resistance pump